MLDLSPRRRDSVGILLLLGASIVVSRAPAEARAQSRPVDIKDLLGRKVVTTSATPLREGTRLIEKDGLFRIYYVDRIDYGRVHIRLGRAEAWVGANHVVPFENAIDYFTEQLMLRPTAGLFNKRGLVYHEREENEQAEADFTKAIALDPKYALAYNNRGQARQALGRLDEAVADYDKAAEIDPKLAVAIANRGSAWQTRGDLDQAIEDYGKAIKIDPHYVMVYNNRGLAWFNKREIDKALADYDKAIKLEPEYAVAYNNRGLARRTNGDYTLAIRDFERAIKVDPELTLGYYNLALILTTCPDPTLRDIKKALIAAKKGCELTEFSDSKYLGLYAAASFESGDLDAAVRWQEKAVALAGTEPDQHESPRACLERYRAARDRGQQP